MRLSSRARGIVVLGVAAGLALAATTTEQVLTIVGLDNSPSFGTSVALSPDRAWYIDVAFAGSEPYDVVQGSQISEFGRVSFRAPEARAIDASDASVIAGSPFLDADGEDSGAALVYDIATEALTELVPADTGPGQHLGSSVAVDGSFAVVGARGDDVRGEDAGAAYLFTTSGTLISKLLPPVGEVGAGAWFGVSVDVDAAAGLVAVGAMFASGPGGGTGAVYLFDTAGEYVGRYTSASNLSGGHFGYSVDLHGATMLVGAPGFATTGGGTAFLVDLVTGTEQQLTPPGVAAFDNVGAAVAIADAETMILGAPGDDTQGPDHGALWVYDASDGQWTQTLQPFNPGPDFGVAVDASSSQVVVGAPRTGSSGTVNIFDLVEFETDADGDGLDDGLDPTPGEQDADGDGRLDGEDPSTVGDHLDGVDDSAFVGAGHRNSFDNLLAQAEQWLERGRTDKALEKLAQARSHTDGCETLGLPDIDDWISDCDEQAALMALIDAIVANIGGA